MRNQEDWVKANVTSPSSLHRSRVSAVLRTTLVCLCLVVGTATANAAEYYVAPTGSDSNAGTMDQPFASLQKGADVAVAGDTVWLRAGTYQSTKQIKLSKSGTSDTKRINFWAYQKEVPLLDCSKYASTNKAADIPAILITGSWLHLRGLEIANVPTGASGDHSISALRSNGGSNNTYERLNIHHNFGPGLFIDTGTGGNLILNCDSHDNYDKNGSQGDGQNGDGFGVHYQTTGPSTIIRGCRAWLNSDDGYDLISQEVPVIVENSWAIQNGYADGGAVSPPDGNGNGFKMGSSETGVRHIVQNNVAWKNKAAGFYANHSSGGNNWFNNTSYMNKSSQYNMLASPPGTPKTDTILTGTLVHKMRNNIGFPNKNVNMGGVDTMFNTWDLNIAEASTDFISTSDTGATGPRTADGGMPAIDFLKLKAGSPLIDKGTNVALPFVGTAPDLGAYEYGAVTAGTGGANGTGGSTAGTGGAGGAGGRGTGGSAGATATGGTVGAGGRAAGGAPGSGGSAAGSGGATSGTGGTITGTGGSVVVGSGGSAASSGGSTGSGGSSLGSGGAAGPGSTGTGGAGSPQTGGAAEPGCACAMSTSNADNLSGGVMGLISSALAFAFAGGRRRKNTTRS